MNISKNNLSIALLISILSSISFQSLAQPFDSWIQKNDFGVITTPTDSMTRYGAVAFSIGNKGYFGTGYSIRRMNDFWEYDPGTDTWSQKAYFIGPARAFASGFSIGVKGYVGCGDENSAAHTSKDFYEFDPVSNLWTRKSDFGGVPRRGAVGFSIGSKGYLGTGRYAGADHYKDIWEYDPLTDAWTQKADLAGNSRAFAAAFSIGSKGYIGTGRDDNTFVKDFWEFDPTYIDPVTQVNTGMWTKKADFAGAVRYGAVGLSIRGYGYIGTGGASGGLSDDFWEYNPDLDNWTQKTNFGGAKRYLAAGFSIGNKGYIGTGQINDNYPNYQNSRDFWEYTPYIVLSGAISTIPCQEAFSLYQNSGNICITTLQRANAEIRISNMLGQVVLRSKTYGNPLTTINSATLQSGVYIVSFSGDGKEESKKIVINR